MSAARMFMIATSRIDLTSFNDGDRTYSL
jgi:hypothetical protein